MAQAGEEVIPVTIYNPSWEEVGDFTERNPESLLFYADVKILIVNDDCLYANASKLARYKFFHDYFSDSHNSKKDSEGFFTFYYAGMEKESWLPLLNFIYGKQDLSYQGLTSMLMENQTGPFEALLSFVEASGILDFCILLEKLFKENCLLEKMQFYEVVRRCCTYKNSLCPPGRINTTGYSLKVVIMSKIIEAFKNRKEISESDLLARMSIFNLDDFDLACNVFGMRLANSFSFLLFLFSFEADVLENSKGEKSLKILVNFDPDLILGCIRITNMVTRSPKYANQVIKHCSERLAKEKQARNKRARTDKNLGSFGFQMP